MLAQPHCPKRDTHLLLVVLDGQLELGQVAALARVQLLAVVVAVVEDDLQLARAARLVQQVLGEELALVRQLLVLLPELILHLAQLLELPAQAEGGEDGVLAGERDERRRGQRLVDVEAGARVAQAVHLRAGHALHAVAADLVRPRHRHLALHQQLDDLVVVGVRRQHDGRDVWRELGELRVHHHGGHLGIGGERKGEDEGGMSERKVLEAL